MTDKILKLLESNVFEDKYIGLKILDSMPRKDINTFLDTHFIKGDVSYGWILAGNLKILAPEKYESQYIEGKYYYAFSGGDIMVDTEIAYEWTKRQFEGRTSLYRIAEVWK